MTIFSTFKNLESKKPGKVFKTIASSGNLLHEMDAQK